MSCNPIPNASAECGNYKGCTLYKTKEQCQQAIDNKCCTWNQPSPPPPPSGSVQNCYLPIQDQTKTWNCLYKGISNKGQCPQGQVAEDPKSGHCSSLKLGTFQYIKPAPSGQGACSRMLGNDCVPLEKSMCKETDFQNLNCKTTPPPPPHSVSKYTCNTTTGTCIQDSQGQYTNQADCKSKCKKVTPPPTSTKYMCSDNYTCVQSDKGPFNDLKSCQDKCVMSGSTTPCNVQGGHGTCVSDLTPAGNRFCIGEDKLCGINLHEGKTCDDMVNQYGSDYIKCKDGYSVKSKQITQGNQKSCILSCERPKITGELLLKMGGVVALFIIVWLLILFVITRSASRRTTQSGFMM